MSKNLCMFALCAMLSSSLIMSSDLVMASGVSVAKEPLVSDAPTQASASLYTKLTTFDNNPLRLSTYLPAVKDHAGALTPCVDAACVGLVAAGMGYAVYANRATLRRSANFVSSGAVKISDVAVSAAKATTVGVASLPSAALYQIKQVGLHPSAAVTGGVTAGAAVAVWYEASRVPAVIEKTHADDFMGKV